MKATDKLLAIALCAPIWIVALAAGHALAVDNWGGPTNGPPRQASKTVTFISQDLHNGGITAAYRGFYTASLELGWTVHLVDGKNDTATIRAGIVEAVRTHSDAIVLGGFDVQAFADVIAAAQRAKIVLAGWHAAAEPGPTKDLFINIATPSFDVAKTAADYAIGNASTAKIGVVIFTDDRFAVANAKTRRMKEIIERCDHCQLLSIQNIPIPNANTEIPLAVPRLDQLYGKAWTHSLAINDVYFDAMNLPLLSAKRTDIQNISAGDGSNIALNRIKSGKSQQIATVAEPAGLQGWQLADELNRAFAGQAPSGYTSKPILVTTQLLKRLGNADIDSDIPYKEAYTEIWQGKSGKDKEGAMNR
jgi:ribose transport system substrate-binding protein